MVFFPSILGVSLVGIFFLTYRYLGEVRSFSRDELERKLVEVPSVRSDILDKFVFPLVKKFREVVMPAILRLVERILNKFRIWVSKLEVRLGSISEEIHGRAINLDVSQKSEYWQNLNTSANSGDSEDVEQVIAPEEPKTEILLAKVRKPRTPRKKIVIK
jgi:hypothetical protein